MSGRRALARGRGRLTSAVFAVCALMLLTASPASADAPPPAPGPASLPALTVPGKPTLKPTDSRGTNVGTNADQDQTIVGMPGSRLGNSPYRISQMGPTSGRTTTGGVRVDSTEGPFVPTPPIPGSG
jgi:hypothetical protein